jgi:hypothetical protein
VKIVKNLHLSKHGHPVRGNGGLGTTSNLYPSDINAVLILPPHPASLKHRHTGLGLVNTYLFGESEQQLFLRGEGDAGCGRGGEGGKHGGRHLCRGLLPTKVRQ